MAAPYNKRPPPSMPTDFLSFAQAETDEQGRIKPTPETQDLYNHWREVEQEAEEQSTFANGLQLRDRQTSVGPNGLLRPRSPSATSTYTSADSFTAITRGVGDVGINDGTVSENGRGKRKAQRHGPLGKITKAKAALVRKLGSCPVCQRRKVKCDHHDLSLFEAQFQGRNRPRPFPIQPRLTVPTPYGHFTPQQTSPTTVPRIQAELLSGVGGDTASFPGPGAGFSDDPEDILRQSPGGGLSPSQARPAQVSPFNPFNAISPIPQRYNINSPVDNTPPQSFIDDEPRPVPIGRQRSGSTDAPGWECQGDRPYSSGASLSSGSSETCLECFSTLEELRVHFTWSHAPFCEATPAYLYKCLRCEFINYVFGTCLQCGNGDGQLESWFYGYLGGSSNSSLPRTSLFVGQDKRAHTSYPGGFPGASNQNGMGGASFYQFDSFGSGNGSGSGSGGNNRWMYGCHSKNDYGTTCCDDPVVVELRKTAFPIHDSHPTPLFTIQGRPSLLHMQFAGLPVSCVILCMMPFLLGCVLLYTAVLEGCPTSDCVGIAVGRTASRIFRAAVAHMSVSSIVCIVVGLAAMWLFKHIRFRRSRGHSSSSSVSPLESSTFGHGDDANKELP